MAARELRWLTYLLTDLGEAPRSPPVLYVDNKAMLALFQEHRLEHRTKHIALRYFLALELQQRGQLRLAYVASQTNTTDVFTKALQPCDHQRFCTVLACFAFLDWSCFLLVPTCFLVQSFIRSHSSKGSRTAGPAGRTGQQGARGPQGCRARGTPRAAGHAGCTWLQGSRARGANRAAGQQGARGAQGCRACGVHRTAGRAWRAGLQGAQGSRTAGRAGRAGNDLTLAYLLT
ncbi:unnamed protein product [Closterium sp. NIES-53]